MQPRVAIVIPAGRDLAKPVHDALQQLVEHSASKGVDCADLFMEGGALCHVARNVSTANVIAKGGYTHVLYMDDDMIPQPDALLRLLKLNVGVASGLYVSREAKPHAVAYELDPLGQGRPIPSWSPNEVREVEWVGAGFLLVRVDVLQATAQAYLDCEWEAQVFPGHDFKEWKVNRSRRWLKGRDIAWFDFRPTTTGNSFGEDGSFCLLARMAGHPTILDCGCVVGHYGAKVYLPSDCARLEAAALNAPTIPLVREITAPNEWCPRADLYSMIDVMSAEFETLEWLAATVRLLKPALVIDTGSYEGWSATFMGRALRQNGYGRLVTLEVVPELHERTAKRLLENGLSDICEARLQSSLDYEPSEKVGFLFSDSAYAVRPLELKRYLPLMSPNGMIAVHDTRNNDSFRAELLKVEGWRWLEAPTPRGLIVGQVGA